MSPGDRTAPLEAAEFARLMDRLEPFERAPSLAVAVSGGRDSLALTLLAADWVSARGGSVLALTVDHGLRPAAAAETRQVADWLGRRGIPHRTLTWRGPKPETGVQAAAREARYRLLQAACRRHGILHLLLAHQHRDQLATHLMRQAHGSGGAGLAAMPALRREGGVRLLRPLLGVDRARLAATLRARGQSWLDDPSNVDSRFERTRIETALDAGAHAVDRSIAAGHARAADERALARLAAETASLSPAGFALIDTAPLLAAPPELRQALFGRLVMTVGGGVYPPPRARLARLAAAFEAAGIGFHGTLGGCRLGPWRGRVAVLRETRNLQAPVRVASGGLLRWDRFACRLHRPPKRQAWVARLGQYGWRAIREALPTSAPEMPAAARLVLPTLWDDRGPLAVPHLLYRRRDSDGPGFAASFRPPHVLSPTPFAVATPGGETI